MSFEPIQERDRVAGRSLAAIAVGGTVITIASIFVAWLIMIAATPHPEQQASAAPPPIGLGTVERSLFGRAQRGLDLRAAHRRELDELTWADRDAGVVRVPIDRAIDLYVTREAQGWPGLRRSP